MTVLLSSISTFLFFICLRVLQLAPSCLRYMARLRNPQIFRFCAIPQVRQRVT